MQYTVSELNCYADGNEYYDADGGTLTQKWRMEKSIRISRSQVKCRWIFFEEQPPVTGQVSRSGSGSVSLRGGSDGWFVRPTDHRSPIPVCPRSSDRSDGWFMLVHLNLNSSIK